MHAELASVSMDIIEYPWRKFLMQMTAGYTLILYACKAKRKACAQWGDCITLYTPYKKQLKEAETIKYNA